jgi:hypothetical protein
MNTHWAGYVCLSVYFYPETTELNSLMIYGDFNPLFYKKIKPSFSFSFIRIAYLYKKLAHNIIHIIYCILVSKSKAIPITGCAGL